jgi:hypothetical protein
MIWGRYVADKGKKRNAHKISVSKLKQKRFRRPNHTCEDNMTMDLNAIMVQTHYIESS